MKSKRFDFFRITVFYPFKRFFVESFNVHRHCRQERQTKIYGWVGIMYKSQYVLCVTSKFQCSILCIVQYTTRHHCPSGRQAIKEEKGFFLVFFYSYTFQGLVLPVSRVQVPSSQCFYELLSQKSVVLHINTIR